ncbi:MAG TPA: hypothetical protein PLJ57_08610, partial [Tepidanaerobacteraceae bacterium]|nr:hypothetical protein [Tepidanaerobacteraceae bacterium]
TSNPLVGGSNPPRRTIFSVDMPKNLPYQGLSGWWIMILKMQYIPYTPRIYFRRPTGRPSLENFFIAL